MGSEENKLAVGQAIACYLHPFSPHVHISFIYHQNDIALAFLYIHRSVHRESNLITVQQDATYSVYYISVGSSTCFGC